MKAIVCVKQVPDTSGKVAVNPDGTLNRASMATIINPDDMNAIEAALTLKDNTGCEVVHAIDLKIGAFCAAISSGTHGVSSNHTALQCPIRQSRQDCHAAPDLFLCGSGLRRFTYGFPCTGNLHRLAH